MRASYRRRRDRVLAAVARYADLVVPEGIAAGLHLVLRTRTGGPDDAQLAAAARRHSLDIGLLSTSWIERVGRPDGLIVGFAAPADHAFTPALEALDATLADVLR
jgi:GntR family transcriptional regulator/MocR family aminotransferase